MAPALDPAVIDSLRQLTPPGEPDVLKEVLQLVLDDVPGRIARLRAAFEAGSAVELQRAAHSLKGSAGNIGAHNLHALCGRLDDLGRVGDLTNAGDLIESLADEYAAVEAEILQLIA